MNQYLIYRKRADSRHVRQADQIMVVYADSKHPPFPAGCGLAMRRVNWHRLTIAELNSANSLRNVLRNALR